MSGATLTPTELLADCDTRGIQLFLADDGDLTIDAPQVALSPNLLAQLKTHKAELLGLLQQTIETIPVVAPVAAESATAKPTKPVCRCGSTTWRNVPIHDGQSARRDCGRCGRFLDFPIWYGKDALQNEMQQI